MSNSSHPLDTICVFLGMQRQELARELGVTINRIADCLRGKSSLQPYGDANRRLIVFFGVRPETTWSENGTPLSLVRRLFTPDWYYAWKSVEKSIGIDEPVAFSLAKGALTAEKRVDWLRRYRMALDLKLVSDFYEVQQKHPNHPLPDKSKFEAFRKAMYQEDPVLKLRFAEVFKHYPNEVTIPTQRELLGAVIRYNLRSYEKLFPNSMREIESSEDLI